MAKMSNIKFRTIMVPVVALLFAIPTILTLTANEYSASLDFALGRGEKHITSVSDVDPEKLEFYERNYDTAEASRLAARDVAQEVEEKGAVLLKNDNNALPISKNSKVTPFGYRYISPFYGGTGSANIDTSDPYVITAEQGLNNYFDVNEDVVNKMKSSNPETMVYDDGNDPTNLSEYNSSIYNGLEDSCKDTVGIVYLARPGTEGYDLNSTTPYSDGTKTQLELTTNERNMIQFAKDNCSKVVVLLITPSPMMISELQNDNEIEAIIWAGLPGAGGYEALSRIMTGEVNPSGKTSDLWYADFKSDPTWFNHLTTNYTDTVNGGPTCFMNYSEGIYVGYRYYETRYAEDNNFTVFGETKGYDDAVVYPFGFGLNYEDDKVTQELESVHYDGENVTIKGTIHNNSKYDVDEVVQIYFGAPYTEGGIEKSAKVLATFDKYNVKANSNYDFELTIKDEDMASYDYKKIYSNDGSYVLEKGNYTIYLGQDSHNDWGHENIVVDETKVYASEAKKGVAVGKRSTDGIEANNILDSLNEHEASGDFTSMSRSDFAGTFPKEETPKAFDETLVEELTSFDYKTDERLGEVEGSLLYKTEDPISNQPKTLTLSDLRGYDYDDPIRDDLLNQLDYESTDIDNVITYALYQTAKVESIGKVETNDNDGTVGLTANWGGDEELAESMGSKTSKVTSCCYPCAPIQAATWDEEVMYKMGAMIGEEGLTNNISGWYAPGLNLHRTPYGGRNFEYYSEDPVLSGKIAASTVGGAFTEGGLYAYIKHFALNETDMNRSSVAVWANEQVCRELYFKGFEICVKNAVGEISYYDKGTDSKVTKEVKASRGLMTSMNYIGVTSPTNSYDLLTVLLRNEWEFEGMVETDFTSGTYKNKDIGYRVGNDLWMAMRTYELDLSTPTAKWCARNAIHNIAYVVVNSNAYDRVAPGAYVYYDMSPWRVALITVDVILYVLTFGGIVWIVLRQLDEKKHKEKYN